MPKPLKSKVDPRHEARKVAVQALFETGFHKTDPHISAARIKEDMLLSACDNDLLETLIDGVLKHKDELDALIGRCAPEWPVDQLPKLDLNILRLAIFELYVDRQVPPKVAIDEAIELAKEFGTESTSGFVNGALGTISKLREHQSNAETALLVGNFQPPHKGHQHAIRQIAGRFPKLLLGMLGQEERKASFERPLSRKERRELMTTMLETMSFEEDSRIETSQPTELDYTLVELPDPEETTQEGWKEALDQLPEKFAVVYTNNPRISEWSKAAGYSVFEAQMVQPTAFNSAQIRKQISLGQPWNKSVPHKVERFLKRRKIVDRLRNLAVAR